VKLNADHSGVCKFGLSQTDRDNFKLVRSNVKDLYKHALNVGRLSIISSPIVQGQGAEYGEDEKLKARFAMLQRGRC
jgi:hypothetical protein